VGLGKKIKGNQKKKIATQQRKGERCEGLGCGQLVAQQTYAMNVHVDAETDTEDRGRGWGGEGQDKEEDRGKRKKKTSTHREEGQGREGLGRRKLVTQQYVHRKGAHRHKGGDGVQQETVEGLHSE